MMTKNTNLVLIGFMGCGKSSIGKKLAKVLEYEFIDCDDQIQKRAGMKIPHIFEKYGESYFRQLERKLVDELKDRDRCVIATGGGAIKDKDNVDNLKKNGTIIYLKSTPQKIYENIKYDTTRPLLQVSDKLAKIEELLEQREPLYIKSADIILDVAKMDMDDAVLAIKKLVSQL